MTISGTATICPGLYYGGISVGAGGVVTMLAGTYYIGGGGFTVAATASVDGSAGVTIFNTSANGETNTQNPGSRLFPNGDDAKADSKTSTDIKPSKNVAINTPVTIIFKLEKKDPYGVPTGTVTFYDGFDLLMSCGPGGVVAVAPDPADPTKRALATCGPITFAGYGTHWLTAIYSGDANYNPSECTTRLPSGTNCPQVGGDKDPIELTITSTAATAGSVSIANSSGTVLLSGPTGGKYSGVTIFQDLASKNTILVQPADGLAACPIDFMTAGTPAGSGTVPAACGALGGIRGTIYAPNADALVLIKASGLANLQVISGMIQVDADASGRFAFTPSLFANGHIHLVE